MDALSRLIPARQFLRMCRRGMRRFKLADSTGAEMTNADLLVRTLVLRRLLRREVLAGDERNVGLLLPPSAGGLVANIALNVDCRVPVNLNYTLSSEVLNACIRQAGIRHVLTSRKVLERFPLKLEAPLVFLEDFKSRVRLSDKLAAVAMGRLWPISLLERWLGLTRIDPESLLTIIFTSGSTGLPKGVMLTHHNVGTNVDAFNRVLRLDQNDTLIGILPFFHSFGYTTTLWTALMLDPRAVYHYTPLEPRQVGALAKKYRGTFLVATPTFLRSYVRKCAPEDFADLDIVITGAEALSKDLAGAFQEQFGVRPVEGYGTTELSPVVSTNIPPCRDPHGSDDGLCEGSVGRPLPGIRAKVVDLETGADLGPDKSGMLLVAGPNVMKGYLDRPDLTAEVMRGEWYVTGDIATIDARGFIHITGRESRFSKLAGEMVPHIHIEQALHRVLQLEEDQVRLVVSAVPDRKKGERIVVLHTGLDRPAEHVCRDLARLGTPALWIPSPESFCQVEQIPVLGTGKLDLRAIKELALQRFPDRG